MITYNGHFSLNLSKLFDAIFGNRFSSLRIIPIILVYVSSLQINSFLSEMYGSYLRTSQFQFVINVICFICILSFRYTGNETQSAVKVKTLYSCLL